MAADGHNEQNDLRRMMWYVERIKLQGGVLVDPSWAGPLLPPAFGLADDQLHRRQSGSQHYFSSI
jgi:hypothetical protein